MPSLSKVFDTAMLAAVQGAEINAKDNPLLVPTMFLISATGQMKVVGWEGDERFHEVPIEDMRQLFRAQSTVGVIMIVEADLFVEDSQGVPQGMQDGVLIYGYIRAYRGSTPREATRTFILDEQRKLIPHRMNVPTKLTAWVKRALSDG